MNKKFGFNEVNKSGMKRNSVGLMIFALCFLAPWVVSAQTGSTESDSSEQLGPLKIFGELFVDDNSIGRNSLEVDEMARSVQVIDAPLIEKIKPAAIEDVLALSSNVSFLGDNDGRENSFVMRGFQSPPILRDGFRVETFGGISDPELYNIERIEVLKGPDSILYGESNPGGLINMRLKRPLSHDHGELVLEVGSNPSVSPRFDFGGGSDNVRYRLVGLVNKDEGWRDFDNDNERVFFAPSLSWALSEKTVLTFIAEITEDDVQADFGTAIDTNGELTAPIEQVNSHPQDTIERHSHTMGFDLTHKFSDSWQMEARARSFDSGYDYSALFLPFGLDSVTNFYMRVPAQQRQDNDEVATQINLNGDFLIGGLQNRLSIGFDYRDSTTENATRFDPMSPQFLDWSNPDYSVLPPRAEDIPEAPGFYSNEDIKRQGFFLQNHLNITEKFMLSLGVRLDDVERDPLPGSSTTAQDYDNTSTQFGVRYDFLDELSLFANFSESFSPNFELDKNNNVLEPELGEGYEIGLKGILLDNRLTYSLAYFDIEKTNVAVADLTVLPTDPNPFGSIAAGKQTSDGFEIDISGEITDRLQLTASLGTSDTEDENGFEIVGAADKTAALWASYQISDQLSIGGGFEHVGDRLVIADLNFDGDGSDGVFLDSHTIFNAFLSYEKDDWQYQLNISNMTDEEYVDAAWGGLSRSVHPGAPLQTLFSVKYSFY